MLNQSLLMSGAEYFDDKLAINPYMMASKIDTKVATREHREIQSVFEEAGIKVIKVEAPEGCQDGVYTANWGLCRGNKVVLSSLPNKRQAEMPYAEKVLKTIGKEVVKIPKGLRFSGQGDALPCGNLLFAGSVYRTDLEVHEFLATQLNYEVISLQTVPLTDENNNPVINALTGWQDSFFYDLDLALAVISDSLIAWCPDAFTTESRAKIQQLNIDKIEVSLDEAQNGFACNLVSTGTTVIMSDRAPNLQAELEKRGLKTITPRIRELSKGGGFIRCTSLTLN